MTEEQIKQMAEDYINENTQGVVIDVNIRNFLLDVYLAGAHSRDEEIAGYQMQINMTADALQQCMDELNQLRNPWISIKDRLPNPEDVVFFRLPNGRPYVGSYFTKDKLFMSIEGCYFVGGVTHWMPIPELKKGE